MEKHTENKPRLSAMKLIMALICCAVTVKLAKDSAAPEYKEAAMNQGSYTVNLPVSYGVIYDRNGVPIINRSTERYAVISGTPESAWAALPYVLNKDSFYEKLELGSPFLCKVEEGTEEKEHLYLFDVPVRNSEPQPAQHIVGYIRDGEGVCGLELDFNDILRRDNGRTSVKFQVDGTGGALAGENAIVRYAPESSQGVITTLDLNIQLICEKAAENLPKGCIVVMEADTGDILAMVSTPTYSLLDMESALESEDSPLINRALYAYPVGSVFKLVTAAAAIDKGMEAFTHNCTGSIEIGSQVFGCHNRSGHGNETLQTALINSCNPYFIALSESLSPLDLFEQAGEMGFGKSIRLTDSINVQSGYLPDVQELSLPAERANFCFGQGKLTAAPVQIARMTCAIANGGVLPEVRLFIKETEDGSTDSFTEGKQGKRVLTEETADKLRLMMIGAVYGGGFKGKPEGTSAGAKTSTAQTGRFDEEGTEYCHGWVTGFFPANKPEYVVTVLAEDAGYGNTAAAPIFKEIAEGISECY